MRFGYAIIYVEDVEETLSFYERAFNLKPSFFHESKQYGELEMGETKLAFVGEPLAKSISRMTTLYTSGRMHRVQRRQINSPTTRA
jgi:catechol 2,3-dioxygenase-like lactoylglutathione lyase family enzyme